MNRRNVLIIISILAFIMIVGGISYSYFVYNKEVGEVSLTTGDISIDLSGSNGNQTLTNVVPVSDFDGINSNSYFDFTVNSTVDTERIYYEVYLLPNSGNTLDTSYLKTYLTDQSNNEIKGITIYNDLGDSEVENGKVIYKGIVEVNNNGTTKNETKNFRLRLWLDESYNEQTSKTFAFDIYLYVKNVDEDFELPYGYNLVRSAILAKQNAETNSCNPIWKDTTDNIDYFSGNNTCVDMNYVEYSGKLWRITSIYSDGAMKLVTQGLEDLIIFNSTEAPFYTNANTYSNAYSWLNNDFYNILYYPNNFIDTSKKWNITSTNTVSARPASTTIIDANVGLLNSFEYYNSYRCVESSTCSGSSYGTGYLLASTFWRLSNLSTTSNYPWTVFSDGTTSTVAPAVGLSMRPAIILKPTVEFAGSGTSDDPYIIIGDAR